jgi:hypothetical protein
MAAFKMAAYNEDLWQQVQADPHGYFSGLGISIPENLEMGLLGYEALKPWPPAIPELQRVTIR